ncbi:hypothetical protein FRC02_008322 [Tulasnella sp. 418]|nr:hypothetical protein FRC02_008322 [Tulasnella sp. 418]
MLSLPENLMNKALAMLVEGITGVDYEAPDLVTPVARLSQKIEALDFVLQAFNEHVRKLVLPMRRQINELLPIHKLPNELLAEVFLEACDGHRAPTRLAAVASRWRSIVISYPRLWHYLNSDSDIRSTNLTLQRSGSTPLDLFCSCKSKSEAEEFFELLAPQSTRWRSIEFNYLDEDGVSLDFLVGQSYPLLEELILPTWGRLTQSSIRCLFAWITGLTRC